MEYLLQEYLGDQGISPFAKWFDALNSCAAAKVTVYLERLSLGNLSNVKALGDGVLELKIDFGPGYRVYFGKKGSKVILLLGGGTKRKQENDIAQAKRLWTTFKTESKGKQ